jgi:hypothetical protein
MLPVDLRMNRVVDIGKTFSRAIASKAKPVLAASCSFFVIYIFQNIPWLAV